MTSKVFSAFRGCLRKGSQGMNVLGSSMGYTVQAPFSAVAMSDSVANGIPVKVLKNKSCIFHCDASMQSSFFQFSAS